VYYGIHKLFKLIMDGRMGTINYWIIWWQYFSTAMGNEKTINLMQSKSFVYLLTASLLNEFRASIQSV